MPQIHKQYSRYKTANILFLDSLCPSLRLSALLIYDSNLSLDEEDKDAESILFLQSVNRSASCSARWIQLRRMKPIVWCLRKGPLEYQRIFARQSVLIVNKCDVRTRRTNAAENRTQKKTRAVYPTVWLANTSAERFLLSCVFLDPEELQCETSSFQFRSLCCIGRLMSMEYSKLVRGVAHLLFSSSTLIISLSAIANSPVCYNQRAQVNKNNKWGNNMKSQNHTAS